VLLRSPGTPAQSTAAAAAAAERSALLLLLPSPGLRRRLEGSPAAVPPTPVVQDTRRTRLSGVHPAPLAPLAIIAPTPASPTHAAASTSATGAGKSKSKRREKGAASEPATAIYKQKSGQRKLSHVWGAVRSVRLSARLSAARRSSVGAQ
jgi:hypothetical protein